MKEGNFPTGTDSVWHKHYTWLRILFWTSSCIFLTFTVMCCMTNPTHSAPEVNNPTQTMKYWIQKCYLKAVVYLIHEVGDGLYQSTVFLSQETISPLLLLQSLFMALPEKLHILTPILRIHTAQIQFILCWHIHIQWCWIFLQGAQRAEQRNTPTCMGPLLSCLSWAALWLWTSIS